MSKKCGTCDEWFKRKNNVSEVCLGCDACQKWYHMVNGRTYRWSGKSENCEYCITGVKETIEHLIIECMGHEQERRVLIGEMKNLIGEEKWDEVKARENEGLSVILGFECEDETLNMNRMKIVNTTKMYLMKVSSKWE